VGITAAILGTVVGAAGVGESVSASGQAQDAANTNIQISQQELARKQQIFGQLQPFFSQYLQQGSPFLQNIQRAGAEQNAQQFGNAAGRVRNQIQTSGLGYGPSGTTAAILGQMGTEEAQSSANSFLSNLLQNEQVKFQAAQGLNSLGQMFSGQNTVGATPQPVQSTIGSSVGALGTSLGNLLNPSTPSLADAFKKQGQLTQQVGQGLNTTGTYNYPPLYPPATGGT
jgi:hypothetical protein